MIDWLLQTFLAINKIVIIKIFINVISKKHDEVDTMTSRQACEVNWYTTTTQICFSIYIISITCFSMEVNI